MKEPNQIDRKPIGRDAWIVTTYGVRTNNREAVVKSFQRKLDKVKDVRAAESR
jgi:hypothetical protein